MFLNTVRWLIATVLLGAQAGAAAQDSPERARTDQVAVRLISEMATVAPGQTVHLGLEQKIIPNWHTYWKNPGDSGTSTSVEWTVPAGVTAGELIWPAPSRFDLGPITNYGYADHVVLLATLTVPASQPIGSTIPVQAKASWLVCEESCIPQEATLKIALPVAAAAVASSEQKPIIDAARAKIPVPVSWPATYQRVDGKLQAQLAMPAQVGPFSTAQLVQQHTLRFYPADWGTAAHNAAQTFKLDGQSLTIALTPGETPPAAGSAVRGVLVAEEKNGTPGHAAIVYSAELGANAPAMPAMPATQATLGAPATGDENITLWHALLLAFAGGVVLNLMPCVFPVLSIKALGLLKHSDLSSAQKRAQGVAYTIGVLASFTVLALALIIIKNLGTQVGWGFQFQSPYFVLGVAYLIFVVGLSLSGVFALGGPANLGAGLAERGGYSGSFFTGVLATIVATPCTAPFMGAALGFALAQPSLVLWLVFMALGLGLALPYMLVSAWPALHRVLPRPGVWMERLKQALAFPMYGAAVWLVWVLAQQAGVNAVPLALGGMIMLALIAWLYDSTRTTSGATRMVANGVLLAAALATVGVSFQAVQALSAAPAQLARGGATQDWEAYSPPRLAQLREQGKPVFINLTAAWCITCLVNEKVALNQPAFKELLLQEGITYLKGDWTNQDPQISALLKQYGRSGVPLYLFYPSGAGSEALVLPQILTQDIVSTALRSR
ncbi:thioredoxin family protein [Massilia sp. PAMC28688]|uniref:protein-disulfide reductase DsbD family protein n=1 Tax=Massilia sp. PAMC28688 TaxID=2861283 RepID=UPI001C63A5CA|nr:protein-disulfide reductase DsbD domain-containing protein [Massilia sp. PAMC28688]QYF95225.1 thioredoxin family protein [Massilia sp. PAMC28688]